MELIRLLDGVTVTEPAPPTELMCRVLCVGAGSAGVYAAAAAAESGADVILLENDVTVGGMHILGGVRGCYYGARGGSFEKDSTNGSPHYTNKSDYKRPRLLQRLRESGVRLLCGCAPTGLILEGDRVRGVTAFDGQRELVIGAQTVIDATSDGFLIRILPVEKQYPEAVPYSVITTCHQGEDIRNVNRDAGYLDPYNSLDFSRKTMLAHADAAELGKEGALVQLASHTGIRQGLCFAGEETLRYADALLQREPENILFWAYSDLDIHGHLRALDDELFQTWWVLCNMSTVAVRIPVPMGCVIPRGWKGIVTAGRCMSADRYAQSAVRMNRDMFRMGECVGVAAALAAEGDLLKIDREEYLRRVGARGCFAGDPEKTMGFDAPNGKLPYRPVVCDPEKNLPLLQTDTPGAFFWSVFRAQDRRLWQDRLRLMAKEEAPLLRGNCALALGILEDPRALPLLRELVEQRDSFWFKDCRRSNQFRSVMAVCLLGRLGTAEDIPTLWDIAFGEEEPERAMYHQLPPDRLYYGGRDRNYLYFQMFTHACAALVKLHKRLGLPMEALRDRLRRQQEGLAAQRIAPEAPPHSPVREELRAFLEKTIAMT